MIGELTKVKIFKEKNDIYFKFGAFTSVIAKFIVELIIQTDKPGLKTIHGIDIQR